jgi:hypothetical protein
MDVRNNSSWPNCDVNKEVVQLFVVPHSKHKVPRWDTSLLVVTSCVPRHLKSLNSQIL